jgi:nucleotide-binding universal stress UspA family protein
MSLPAVRAVLVTTDFSELGDRAVPWACAILAPGGVVHLVHVIEPPHAPNPLYAHYTPGRTPTPEERAAQRRALEDRLRALLPDDAAARDVTAEVDVAEDRDVAHGICRIAAEREVDVICMSSHGRSGLSKAVLGSVAERVLERCARPLLVVR